MRTSVCVKLPYLDHSITIPDNVKKREVGTLYFTVCKLATDCGIYYFFCSIFMQKTVSYFAQRCQQILELAIKWAPLETKAILEVQLA